MGRGETGEQPGAPLQEHSFIVCCAQSGLRLFPKLVHVEEVIDLFSALPFSACSTLWRAIDLPCKGQIFSHMLREEFSINDSGPAIPAVIAPYKYLWASALPARSPSSSFTFLLQGQGESCFYSHGITELMGSGVSHRERRWQSQGEGQMLPPSLSCRSEMGAEPKTQNPEYRASIVLLHPQQST